MIKESEKPTPWYRTGPAIVGTIAAIIAIVAVLMTIVLSTDKRVVRDNTPLTSTPSVSSTAPRPNRPAPRSLRRPSPPLPKHPRNRWHPLRPPSRRTTRHRPRRSIATRYLPFRLLHPSLRYPRYPKSRRFRRSRKSPGFKKVGLRSAPCPTRSRQKTRQCSISSTTTRGPTSPILGTSSLPCSSRWPERAWLWSP